MRLWSHREMLTRWEWLVTLHGGYKLVGDGRQQAKEVMGDLVEKASVVRISKVEAERISKLSPAAASAERRRLAKGK